MSVPTGQEYPGLPYNKELLASCGFRPWFGIIRPTHELLAAERGMDFDWRSGRAFENRKRVSKFQHHTN